MMKAQCFVQTTQTNVTCYGGCDGTASAFPVGTGPFTYLWMPGNMTSQNIVGLCAGNYYLTMTDGGTGCTATAMVNITQPNILNLVLSSTPASCPTCCDGSITATAGGGTAPYSYTWTPSGGTGPVASSLCPGSYTCCVVDINGCSTCSNLSVSFTTDIQGQAEKNYLTLYPNPAANFVTVDQNFETPTSTVLTLSNVLGEVVYTKSSGSASNLHEVINLSTLPEGLYFISLKTNSGTTVKRIIKE